MGAFDDLLVELQGSGWYQKRIVYFMIGPIFFITPFAFLSQIFVLHIPDHWCHPPPGLEPATLNVSLPEWKSMFLPQEMGPDYQMRASKCNMYSVSEDNLPLFLSGQLPGNATDLQKTECRQLEGYDYDTSELKRTAVTDNDWVCDLEGRATSLYTIGVVGLIIGAAVLSWLADLKGRRFSFYISTACVLVFSLVPIWLSHSYGWFMAFKVLSFAAMLPLFQSPLNICTEISTAEQRGIAIGISCITWAIGNCVLPLVAYLIPWWQPLVAVCTTPIAFIFLCWKILPESPRWLIQMKRTEEAKVIMNDIAKVNGVTPPKDMDERLVAMAEESTDSAAFGYLALFSSWTLALRTVCVTVAFTSSAFVYYQLVINIGNMAGNIFLNMFLLGLVEGPGCALGVYASERFGRRWSHCALLLTNAVLFFALMWVVYDPSLKPLVIFFCMFIKFNISGTFVIAYVQAMEVFPTCIRQCGIGFATLISQTISIGGPYVIYLGATDLKLPYAIMFLICAAGAVATFLLPETLGCKLPETLQEAAVFGKSDPYFSFLPHKKEQKAAELERKAAAETEEGKALADDNQKDGSGHVRSPRPSATNEDLRLHDWNVVMAGVMEGVPGNAAIVRDFLERHMHKERRQSRERKVSRQSRGSTYLPAGPSVDEVDERQE